MRRSLRTLSYWPSKATRCRKSPQFELHQFTYLTTPEGQTLSWYSVGFINWRIISLSFCLPLPLAACISISNAFLLDSLHLIMPSMCAALLQCFFMLTLAGLHTFNPTDSCRPALIILVIHETLAAEAAHGIILRRVFIIPVAL